MPQNPKGKAKAKAKTKNVKKDCDDEPGGGSKKPRHKKCEQDVNRIAALRSRRTTVKSMVRHSVGHDLKSDSELRTLDESELWMWELV